MSEYRTIADFDEGNEALFEEFWTILHEHTELTRAACMYAFDSLILLSSTAVSREKSITPAAIRAKIVQFIRGDIEEVLRFAAGKDAQYRGRGMTHQQAIDCTRRIDEALRDKKSDHDV